MFCKNCGNQVPDGVAFCAACGTPVPVAAPVQPAEAAYGYAPVAPAAAPAAPANPSFFAVLWAKIRGFISFIATAKTDKKALIALIAVIAAAATVITIIGGVLISGNSAKGVATKYVKAYLDGDIQKQLSLTAGKAKACFEANWEDEDDLFEVMEKDCDDADVDVSINNFKQFYKAGKKYTKAEKLETYKKILTTKVAVRKVEKMSNKELDAIRELVDDDSCEDYINPDKIKDGQFVVVKVYIDGKEHSFAGDVVVPVVKYGGSWKVLDVAGNATLICNPYSYDTYSWYDDGDSVTARYNEDYRDDYDDDKEEAEEILEEAIDKLRGW